MGPTHRNTWKRAESKVAALFGCRRQRCSGSSGRPDCSASDSTSDILFIETKYRAEHAACGLYDATRDLARREGKIAVVALVEKRRPGVLILIDPEDLIEVAAQYAAARGNEAPDESPSVQ